MLRNIVLTASAAMLVASLGSPAFAQQKPATCALSCVWDFSSPDKKQVDINAAVASETARRGGFGPGHAYSTTNIEEQTIHSTHNGDAISSGSTNVNNMSSTSNRTEVGNGNQGVTIVAHNGTSQVSRDTTQSGTSQTSVSHGSTTQSSATDVAN